MALMGEPALGDAMAGVDDATRVDAIAVLESISGAVAAAQAWAEIELYTSQVQVQQGQGVPTRRRDRGVADQIGLARRISGASAAPSWAWRTPWSPSCRHLRAVGGRPGERVRRDGVRPAHRRAVPSRPVSGRRRPGAAATVVVDPAGPGRDRPRGHPRRTDHRTGQTRPGPRRGVPDPDPPTPSTPTTATATGTTTTLAIAMMHVVVAVLLMVVVTNRPSSRGTVPSPPASPAT